ncbi:carbohydrate ABC transporter permease [Demequina maris]|uniref:carbohydrate ABC transporter permease n=1 Tax=Demequina maris TaxID=1638982 RepID=UPI0007856FB7|nr:sugar ABC transporter permease [Demequina maris]
MKTRPEPTAAEPSTTPTSTPTTRRRRRRGINSGESRGAWILLAPYMLLFAVAAFIPIVYAFYTALQKSPTLVNPESGFGGFHSFLTVFKDYRFFDTFGNILTVLAVWLPVMIVAIVALALMVDASRGRFGRAMRFIYYIPGALAGIANFVLWVYLLNPALSPLGPLWEALGMDTLKEVVTDGHMPLILSAMLLFQGIGTWIVIVIGGLNGISDEVLEAAALDGASAWQLAWKVKLPLIRPWIGYAALMNLAYGFQLFLEPYLLRQVSAGSIDAQWTPNQLGYAFAFDNRDFPAAAAMSIILLAITLGIGMLIVFRSGLFGDEGKKS